MTIRCTVCRGTYVERATVLGQPIKPYCRGCGRQDTGKRR
jgi:hypothetical protein